MKWRGREGSSNIEDRRAMGGKKAKGLGGIVLTAVIAYVLSGGDMSSVINAVISETINTNTQSIQAPTSKEDTQYAKFTAVVLKDTEDVWSSIFAKSGYRYEKPRLVMFRGSTHSACGQASSAMGPFYCPSDKKVYIDLGFYDELLYKFKASGDFARAYVIAHEVAHHVQNLTGVLPRVNKQKRTLSKVAANKLSVKVELQADCYAGIWARMIDKNKSILETGDIDEALHAASRIGDDTLQKQAQGRVVPDSFTHGTSAQRKEWFYRGYNSANLKKCDTFKVTF